MQWRGRACQERHGRVMKKIPERERGTEANGSLRLPDNANSARAHTAEKIRERTSFVSWRPRGGEKGHNCLSHARPPPQTKHGGLSVVRTHTLTHTRCTSAEEKTKGGKGPYWHVPFSRGESIIPEMCEGNTTRTRMMVAGDEKKTAIRNTFTSRKK